MITSPRRTSPRQRLMLQALEARTVPVYFVNNLGDAGPGTLRQAIINANLNPGPDVIDASAVTGTISLATSLPWIFDDVGILGPSHLPGPPTLTVDGGGVAELIRVKGIGTTTVDIADFTLTRGRSTGNGGAVFSAAAHVGLHNMVISDCVASYGGGVATSAGSSLDISDTTLHGNFATGGGGAIFNEQGTPVHKIAITNCTISGNTAANYSGGGILLTGGPSVVIIQSTVSGNTAYYHGGGLRTESSFTGSVDIHNSTLTRNVIIGGGVGRGISRNGGSVFVESTIVAQNQGGSPATGDLSGFLTGNYSFIGNAGTATLAGVGNIIGSAAAPIDAMLNPLADNGGIVLTHLPKLTSPVLDVGVNTLSLGIDQRKGPRLIGGKADIGSVERDPSVPDAAAAISDVNTAGGMSFDFNVTFTDSTAIDVSLLDSSDILITGPGGFIVAAKHIGVDVANNGSPRVASYQFTPPGGQWDPSDGGTYRVLLQPNQVANTAGKFVPGGMLGTFQVLAAHTWIVNSTNDESLDTDGKVSLREAILAANAASPMTDSITFDPVIFGTAATITLGLGELLVTDSVAIVGPATGVTVNGNQATRIFNLGIGGVGAVSINNLTMTSGNAGNAPGGAINPNDDNLTLTNCTVSNSFTQGPGGGIGNGGAGGTWTLTNCSISGNFAGTNGGGSYFFTTGSLVMDNCTVTGNTSASANGGAGAYFFNNSATIRNSTFSGNHATGSRGGGITLQSSATVVIQNCTIVNNDAATTGGGINQSAGILSIESSIVAGNQAQAAGDDLFGTPTVGFSLIGTSDGATIQMGAGPNLTGTKASPLDPMIGLLVDNGGPTLTHALLPGSPAIDKGSSPIGLLYDQRGTGHSRVNGTVADVGAFETLSTIPTAAATAPDVLVPGGASQTITVTYTDDIGINVGTLTNGDIVINGPGGTFPVVFKTLDIASNGTPRVATYEMMAPGGVWDGADSGAYTITMNANEVLDTDAATHVVPPGPIGVFKVVLPNALVVTNDQDNGPGSLRQAILNANAVSPSVDSITFDPNFFSASKHINLTTQTLVITDDVVIEGLGAKSVIIDGKNQFQVFQIDIPNRQGSVTISGVSIVNGNATTNGGGIFSADETLNLKQCTVSNNKTTGNGGGIFIGIGGTLFIREAALTANTAGGDGGAIGCATGHHLEVREAALSANSAGGSGGAISCASGQHLEIREAAIYANTAGAGGGALSFSGASTAIGLLISNSTISANSTLASGGGIWLESFFANFEIQNCTIVGNAASGASGQGGGIGHTGGGLLALESSIVSGNNNSAAPDIFSATPLSLNYCAVGSPQGFSFNGGNNLPFATAFKYDLLADNGGPTLTHALLPGSLCINAGSNPGMLTTDQRGPGFARTANGFVDIGAFELQLQPAKVTSVQVNDGAAQRSRVTNLTVSFDQTPTLPANPADAFQLTRQGNNAQVALNALQAGNIVTLDFIGGSVNGVSLADGFYTLRVLKSQVNGGYFDSSGSSIPGDDYVLVGNTTNKLFRLFGDADGNSTVNSTDFAVFRSFFGLGASMFDYDNDGQTNSSDFAEFRKRFGITLVP